MLALGLVTLGGGILQNLRCEQLENFYILVDTYSSAKDIEVIDNHDCDLYTVTGYCMYVLYMTVSKNRKPKENLRFQEQLCNAHMADLAYRVMGSFTE
jgi:hypothetical protein